MFTISECSTAGFCVICRNIPENGIKCSKCNAMHCIDCCGDQCSIYGCGNPLFKTDHIYDRHNTHSRVYPASDNYIDRTHTELNRESTATVRLSNSHPSDISIVAFKLLLLVSYIILGFVFTIEIKSCNNNINEKDRIKEIEAKKEIEEKEHKTRINIELDNDAKPNSKRHQLIP